MNSANLALRFLLELAALAGFAVWAWQLVDGLWRYGLAFAVVLFVMMLWSVFAVPDDPSRSGNAPFPVPGFVRLVLELAILFGGAYAWYLGGYSWAGLVIGILIAIHYGLSVPRIMWLLQQ